MTIDIAWQVPATLIEQTLTGHLTDEEIHASAVETAALLDTSDKPLVHVVINAEQVAGFPAKVGQFAEAMRPMLAHQRLGWVIIYGLDEQVLAFVAMTAAQMFKVRFRLFDTRAEALGHLQFVDSTLPDLTAGI